MEPAHGTVRFKALDGLRGVAALLVAVFHFQVLTHIYFVPFVRHSYLFVDFFFVLSGFVISHAYCGRLNERDQVSRFIIHRFGRLWPLHAAVLAAFVGVEALKLLPWLAGMSLSSVPFDGNGANPPSAIANHLLLTHAIGIYEQPTWNDLSWSVSVEFWASVVFALAALAAPTTLTLTLSLVGVIAAFTLVTCSDTGMDVTTSYGLARCLAGFAMGHLVWRWRSLVSRPALARGTIYEVLAVVLIAGFVTTAGRGQLSFAAPFVFALPVLIFSLEAGALSRFLQWRALQATGRWSYSIYLVQGFVILVGSLGVSLFEAATGTPIWTTLPGDPQSTRVVAGPVYLLDALLLVYLALVIAISAYTYQYIEQPGIRAFDRLAALFAPARDIARDAGAVGTVTRVAPLLKTR